MRSINATLKNAPIILNLEHTHYSGRIRNVMQMGIGRAKFGEFKNQFKTLAPWGNRLGHWDWKI